MVEKYQDIFAVNPRKPKRTKIGDYRIETGDALPVKWKQKRLVAYENDIHQQVQEMLKNDVSL